VNHIAGVSNMVFLCIVMPIPNVVPAGACAERSRSMTESPFLFEMPDGRLKFADELR